MGRTVYTYQGLEKLSGIIKTARGSKSVRKFAREVGVSYATISRLENGELKEPEMTTLQKLAQVTGYTKEELITICEDGVRPPEVRMYRLAEDVLPVIDQLPDAEAAKVAQHIISRLVRRPQPSFSEPLGNSVAFNLELMSNEQLAETLIAIANRIKK